MRCRTERCTERIEGEAYEEMLLKGFAYCSRGHRSTVPGSTKMDVRCDCGARAINHPIHSRWCTEYRER